MLERASGQPGLLDASAAGGVAFPAAGLGTHKRTIPVNWCVARFLVVNGSIAVAGYGLLMALIFLGWQPLVANATQAVVTLEINFIAGLFYTWRHQTLGLTAGLKCRWCRFHIGRGSSVVANTLLFPLISPVLGATAAFVGLLALGTSYNYLIDKRWAFVSALKEARR